MANKVPQDYFSPLTAERERKDKADKPELSYGVFEFLAPKEYIHK